VFGCYDPSAYLDEEGLNGSQEYAEIERHHCVLDGRRIGYLCNGVMVQCVNEYDGVGDAHEPIETLRTTGEWLRRRTHQTRKTWSRLLS
jgi:hypothetical protein